MLLVAVSFGLRISEVLGLKWKDLDWLRKTISIERGVVKQIVGDVKSNCSLTLAKVRHARHHPLKGFAQLAPKLSFQPLAAPRDSSHNWSSLH
jgi:integrase